MRSGPLAGLRVVELAGLGPAPFCGMILADLGAEVIRVDRTDGQNGSSGHDLLNRSKSSIAVNLKTPEGVEVVLALATQSAIFIEGFRPGVAERLGVGPDHCFGVNPS
ncbi:MAG: CoA transferase, partial [Acidimicrobiia bacterium]